MYEHNLLKGSLQTLLSLTTLSLNGLCNITCVVIYPVVFRKWFSMKRQNGQKDKFKAEFSLVIIDLYLCIVNTLFTLYCVLTVYAISTGMDIMTFASARDGCALFEGISLN